MNWIEFLNVALCFYPFVFCGELSWIIVCWREGEKRSNIRQQLKKVSAAIKSDAGRPLERRDQQKQNSAANVISHSSTKIWLIIIIPKTTLDFPYLYYKQTDVIDSFRTICRCCVLNGQRISCLAGELLLNSWQRRDSRAPNSFCRILFVVAPRAWPRAKSGRKF